MSFLAGPFVTQVTGGWTTLNQAQRVALLGLSPHPLVTIGCVAMSRKASVAFSVVLSLAITLLFCGALVAAPTAFPDCNENGIDDAIDISEGTSTDCDENGVPDECSDCPPVDIVFVMDTSGSMDGEAAALCASIAQVTADLTALGLTVSSSFLGITETPGGDYACLTDNVLNMLGAPVPGSLPCCPNLDHYEDWGPATAIVAARFPWTPNAIRVIVPLSDEGAENGNGCADPGNDRDAITNAIAGANTNDVIVSPITGSGSSACVLTLATDLAAGTGGITFASANPGDLPGAIEALVLAACESVSDCNDNGIADLCEEDCNENFIPDDCELNSETDADGNGILDECDPCLTGDTTAPVFVDCPDDVTIPVGADCVLPEFGADALTGLVSDDCTEESAIVITQAPAAGSEIGVGTTELTLSATDEAGNTATCTVLVTVDEGGCLAPAPQPVPGGCDPTNQSLNLLMSFIMHAPVCGATCPIVMLMTLTGLVALRRRRHRR